MAIEEKPGAQKVATIRLPGLPLLASLEAADRGKLEAWWREVRRILEPNIDDKKLSGGS